ncbi:minichromosome maintenance protein MCM [Archaeoglobus profundus]|uniref:MCM family protein n=1 Tax=Archaeoglobus profundus (strain DSM 5631 / JCM 9629 / NBRC 100127 / Av18) TaxID=572546 RepID=D2RF51_ARCPA|nr:minichromosome maintenance protein MCM [Archaeoglobus profundus]ADB58745.1 MCM family protein [Archaeoglobus profundus DSM 5631]
MISSEDPLVDFVYYIDAKLKNAVVGENIVIDFEKDGLTTFLISRGFWDKFKENPVELLRRLESHILERLKMYDVKEVKVKYTNWPKFLKKEITEVRRVNNIGKLVVFEGVVRKITSAFSRIRNIQYHCTECGSPVEVEPVDGRIPKVACPKCGSKKFELIAEEKKDCQVIEVQEYPEGLRRQPESIKVYLYDDLVGLVYPGDKVVVAGILKEVRPPNKSYGDFVVEAISIEFVEDDLRNINLTSEDVQKIKELAKDPQIYEKLAKSLAPTVKGHDAIKQAIVLQLFGGVTKVYPNGTKRRGNIHILLVGDPSTAKSQLAESVAKVAPRSVFVDGTLMTKVGLTVTTSRDEVTGRWTIEAGALVLADNGIAIIDEIEKAKKDDLEGLERPLEQQVVNVSKAGINATLNARTSVLACANPKRGRFDRHEPIVEQIKLSPPLLSRFDLIFVLLDEPDEVRDAEIADFILSGGYEEPPIDPELFKKYILYARNNITNVELSEGAKRKLKEFYTEMRIKSKETGSIAITTRQLEALKRLTEASAKVRLSNVATEEDAERAIRIFEESIKQVAIDPETGNIDIDYAISGVSAKQRDDIRTILDIIEEFEEQTPWGASEETILAKAEEKGIPQGKALELLDKLKKEGDIFSPRFGYFKRYGR